MAGTSGAAKSMNNDLRMRSVASLLRGDWYLVLIETNSEGSVDSDTRPK